MSKFRQNHTKHNRSGGFLFRAIFITLVLMAILIFGFTQLMKEPGNLHKNATSSRVNKDQQDNSPNSNSQSDDKSPYVPQKNDKFFIDINDRHFLPKDKKSQTIHHTYYSLGYNEDTEQANWVSYVLTKASLKVKNVKRERYFKADYSVKTRSAFFRDYKNSGYTKGHMAPAGDMAFSKQAMKETFFMSNICPQIRPFNNGVWKELEENVRDWAYSKDELYITTGPIYYDNQFDKIGQNRVGVPDAFYKILIDKNNNKYDAIAFVVPHQKSNVPLREYATTIDEVEELTNIDFTYRFFGGKSDENIVEKEYNLGYWPINENRYKQRVNIWNKEN